MNKLRFWIFLFSSVIFSQQNIFSQDSMQLLSELNEKLYQNYTFEMELLLSSYDSVGGLQFSDKVYILVDNNRSILKNSESTILKVDKVLIYVDHVNGRIILSNEQPENQLSDYKFDQLLTKIKANIDSITHTTVGGLIEFSVVPRKGPYSNILIETSDNNTQVKKITYFFKDPALQGTYKSVADIVKFDLTPNFSNSIFSVSNYVISKGDSFIPNSEYRDYSIEFIKNKK